MARQYDTKKTQDVDVLEFLMEGKMNLDLYIMMIMKISSGTHTKHCVEVRVRHATAAEDARHLRYINAYLNI